MADVWGWQSDWYWEYRGDVRVINEPEVLLHFDACMCSHTPLTRSLSMFSDQRYRLLLCVSVWYFAAQHRFRCARWVTTSYEICKPPGLTSLMLSQMMKFMKNTWNCIHKLMCICMCCELCVTFSWEVLLCVCIWYNPYNYWWMWPNVHDFWRLYEWYCIGHSAQHLLGVSYMNLGRHCNALQETMDNWRWRSAVY